MLSGSIEWARKDHGWMVVGSHQPLQVPSPTATVGKGRTRIIYGRANKVQESSLTMATYNRNTLELLCFPLTEPTNKASEKREP